jgi:hypothetical protein
MSSIERHRCTLTLAKDYKSLLSVDLSEKVRRGDRVQYSHLSYISKELMRYDGVAAGFDIFERVLE